MKVWIVVTHDEKILTLVQLGSYIRPHRRNLFYAFRFCEFEPSHAGVTLKKRSSLANPRPPKGWPWCVRSPQNFGPGLGHLLVCCVFLIGSCCGVVGMTKLVRFLWDSQRESPLLRPTRTATLRMNRVKMMDFVPPSNFQACSIVLSPLSLRTHV